ncbi:CGNR zinc finger domain-containing protein [Luteolibacter sp. GHJ8]|uniref:CGNR zinc finger domain-containing protein n=1 Tax=Luteolibacter rhizosphaerae TaxID=2989719 RepID=A0ABT3FYR5_9BACT|nr:CGNR zinc finger domain-containing protein [Luteolibacter rhizosphaerae]MCW1912716.1 CGNR zinc finger domain-containing protein [Luteolibacter rhizosphaerae]
MKLVKTNFEGYFTGVSSAVPEFVFLGEHPALDFANTLYAPHGELEDQLRSWADVREWLRQASLDDEVGTAGDLEAVVALRSAWAREIAGMLAGKPVSKGFLKALNAALEKDHFSEAVTESLELVRSSSRLQGSDRVMAILARQIASFLTECNRDYLRQCAGHGCVLYFYDTTKNHRRQWCSAAACGNRHKVAAFRERQAKKKSS